MTIAAVIAGLLIGLLAGLFIKPSRQVFSICCGTTLGCLTCRKEARDDLAAPRPAR